MPKALFPEYQPEQSGVPGRFGIVNSAFLAEHTRTVGLRNMMILILIASQTNAQGRLKIPVSQLAEMAGVSVQTIERSLRDLTTVEVQGKRLVERAQTRKENGDFSVPCYQIMPCQPEDDTSWALVDEPLPFPLDPETGLDVDAFVLPASYQKYGTPNEAPSLSPPISPVMPSDPDPRTIKSTGRLNRKRVVVLESSEAPEASGVVMPIEQGTQSPRRSASRITREASADKAPAKSKPTAPVRDTVNPQCGADLLALYLDLYQKRYGRAPASLNHGAFGSRLKAMGTAHGFPVVKEWLRSYFDEEFPGQWRWAKKGHPWNIFCTATNEIAAVLLGDAKEQAPIVKPATPAYVPHIQSEAERAHWQAIDDAIEAELAKPLRRLR